MARRVSLRGEVLSAAADAAATRGPAVDQPQDQTATRPDGSIERTRISEDVRTVDQLLEVMGADLGRYEVAASEATSWEAMTADRETGRPHVVTLHRVWVRLKPRGGPAVPELVEALIAGAERARRFGRPGKPPKPGRGGGLQVLVIADCHFGKYAWHRTTGHGDYDLDHADRFVRDTGERLLDSGDAQRPAARVIALLGDLFHYDGAGQAKTTAGTPLERDGRLEKMLSTGCESLHALVHRSAATVPTQVVIVPGNHDETHTAWFRMLTQTAFRGSRAVTVADEYTHRQYLRHGGNLLGFAHGNRARRTLPQLMALERPADWGQTVYREIHTGHLHTQRSRTTRVVNDDGLDTIDGVVVRTAPAICPPDDWHAVEGYVGSRQAMESFFYRPSGGLDGMIVAAPRRDGE